MLRKIWLSTLILTAALLFGGCAMRTVDEMYSPPRRSDAYNELQSAIDRTMGDMEYCAPENIQSMFDNLLKKYGDDASVLVIPQAGSILPKVKE